MNSLDHFHTDTVICPYCGFDNGDNDGDSPASGQQRCSNEDCEKNFDCEPSYSVTYSTSKVPCWNGEPHDWKPPYDPRLYKEKVLRSCRDCQKSEWVKKCE